MGDADTDSAGTALAAPTCPVCSTGLTRNTTVLCERCHAPHHRRCWAFQKGCGTFGCGSRAFVVPRAGGGGEPGPRLELSRRLCTDWSLFLVWLVILGASAATGFARPLVTLGALLLPLLLTARVTVNTETECLEQRFHLGPLVWWRSLEWLPFPEIEELEVRERLLPSRRRGKKKLLWEVWARDRAGRAFLLGEQPTADLEGAKARLQDAAVQLDTVLSLPRRVLGEGALPPGLEERIAQLPGDGGVGP